MKNGIESLLMSGFLFAVTVAFYFWGKYCRNQIKRMKATVRIDFNGEPYSTNREADGYIQGIIFLGMFGGAFALFAVGFLIAGVMNL